MHTYVEDGDPESITKRRTLHICPVSFSPLIFIDRTSSYNKIPQQPLNLTVLKLDGTSFEISVSKNGTVADMKEAVEAAFYYFPLTVSWTHVWGHFCLAYAGHKLLSDDDYISGYDIQDGDQIQFIRHISDNCKMRRTRSEKEGRNLEELSLKEIVSRKGEENEELKYYW